jgi:hypothetical protein
MLANPPDTGARYVLWHLWSTPNFQLPIPKTPVSDGPPLCHAILFSTSLVTPT